MCGGRFEVVRGRMWYAGGQRKAGERDMKITDVKAFATRPPEATRNYVFVKVATDEGSGRMAQSRKG